MQLMLRCEVCDHEQPYEPFVATKCGACGGAWLDPVYDYARFRAAALQGLPDRPQHLWRFRDVLPVAEPAGDSLMPVGGTPLVHAQRYGALLNHRHLYIKDERYGPTSSFKDRQACLAVAALLAAGVNECVIASTGNAGVAYAAACARAGIKLWVFMPAQVPHEKLREAALFGAEVVTVGSTYDQTKQIAARFAERRGLVYDRGAGSIPAREAMKTIAYEIVEQRGWQAPDWYVQSVSGGLGPLGVFRGFHELHQMGLIDRIPKLAVIQADGCAPMVRAFEQNASVATPVEPDTLIAILSTGDPGATYTRLWQLVQTHGGVMASVSDAQAFVAMRQLARTEGMAVEPATAVAFAGLEQLIRDGHIGRDEDVVVNCTGHTFPVEKHVLDDRWQVEVQVGTLAAPRDHLLEALDQVDEQTTTVLVIEDNPDDALLIERLVLSRKAYRVFRASDGHDGVLQARQRLPDLIVLDLTMPKLDGFGVLAELRADPRTQAIPVVVVSAKEITAGEKEHLMAQTAAVYQKGSLPTRAFVDQVVHVLDTKSSKGGAN